MEPAQQLAQDILKLSFNLLRVRLRFLDLALSGLRSIRRKASSGLEKRPSSKMISSTAMSQARSQAPRCLTRNYLCFMM